MEEEPQHASHQLNIKALGGLVVPIKSKVNMARMYHTQQLKSTPRARDFKTISKPFRSVSRLHSPRARTAGGFR